MKEVTRRITVDLSRRGTVRPTFAVQNDLGSRTLLVKLTDDGAPYSIQQGCVPSLNYKRPDEVRGALAGTVKDGEILFFLHPSAICEVGITVCNVSLFDENGNKLTSSEFCIEVSEELYVGQGLFATPEYTLLEGLFAKISGYELAENARVEAEEERVKAEEERARSEAMRDKKLNSNLGSSGSVVIKADSWSAENTQSITVAELGESDLIIFYPSSDIDLEIIAFHRIFILPETDGGKVLIKAKASPVEDIRMNYFITRGRVDDAEV